LNIAIILAGGTGQRMGNHTVPKQYLDIYGKPIIVHTIEHFEMSNEIDAILVVANQQYHENINVYKRKYDLSKLRWIVEGGDSRQVSSFKALSFLREFVSDDDIIVIHDAVRPLITPRIISDNIQGAKDFGAVDTCIVSSDTIIESHDGETISSVPPRKNLYLGQTPQSFKYSIIYNAHVGATKDKIEEDITDDCKLVRHYNIPVHIVKGEPINFKITYSSDVSLLKALLRLGTNDNDN
jgi:2-C-methyl-D-erythritol 4-phosphate cytidylyltransferase